MKLVADFPYLSIYLHTSKCQVLEMQWKGFVNSADFRQAIKTGLQLARQYQIVGWLADDRLLGAVRPKDLDWSFTYLHPELAASGVERFALLEADETLNRFIIGRKYEEAALPFALQRFTNLEEAREWVCR
ncbi:hypothetical protein DNI29_10555 [Hymenobacter sediminis]|uniref:STAS/SEC14 domain-containing protein n=1 Tax=Hymenobacter sediminis TaxID=2218621 RepID=UPI000DA692BC|nr:STAS/SEC14 domain-containing protein [Hymenobacter sediminis]RPD47869.1 hypothetical protein DNI29_10555 [Hymenobacter sediminis]